MDLTVEQVAARLDRHPDLVRRWIRAGGLPAYKIGTYWFVRARDLDTFVEPGRKPWKRRAVEREGGDDEGGALHAGQ